MRLLSFATNDLERRLLHRGVGALAAVRPRCRECRRTPLVGEEVFLYASGRMLCALCADKHREEPVSVEPVRSAEWGHAVRRAAAA